jgi:acyl-CoA synthetase (AMP-forming)/AMP-acid ligase II
VTLFGGGVVFSTQQHMSGVGLWRRYYASNPLCRSKDVIKSGGEWISSIQLENAAMGHPKARIGASFCAVLFVALDPACEACSALSHAHTLSCRPATSCASSPSTPLDQDMCCCCCCCCCCCRCCCCCCCRSLLRHSIQVLEAAVVGVPHDKWGERPLLVVVPQQGQQGARPHMHSLAWFALLTHLFLMLPPLNPP